MQKNMKVRINVQRSHFQRHLWTTLNVLIQIGAANSNQVYGKENRIPHFFERILDLTSKHCRWSHTRGFCNKTICYCYLAIVIVAIVIVGLIWFGTLFCLVWLWGKAGFKWGVVKSDITYLFFHIAFILPALKILFLPLVGDQFIHFFCIWNHV